MQHDGDLGALDNRGLHQLHKIGVVGIGAGALGDLENHRGLLLAAGLGNALHDLHVVDVEGADGVAPVVGLLEHLGRSDQCHNNHLLILLRPPFPTLSSQGRQLPAKLKNTGFEKAKTFFSLDNITKKLKCKYLQFFFSMI